jgi:diadenosine tetraphosphate (Ap4A) HIT family hydrolase
MHSTCPFCHPTTAVELGKHWRLIKDKYPVTRGHHLIVPNRHVEDLTDLTKEERAELGLVLVEAFYCIKIIASCMDGFNIGVNNGSVAGQTISHLHFHFIPRREGDVEDPTGGVRGVIPNKRTY